MPLILLPTIGQSGISRTSTVEIYSLQILVNQKGELWESELSETRDAKKGGRQIWIWFQSFGDLLEKNHCWRKWWSW